MLLVLSVLASVTQTVWSVDSYPVPIISGTWSWMALRAMAHVFYAHLVITIVEEAEETVLYVFSISINEHYLKCVRCNYVCITLTMTLDNLTVGQMRRNEFESWTLAAGYFHL